MRVVLLLLLLQQQFGQRLLVELRLLPMVEAERRRRRGRRHRCAGRRVRIVGKVEDGLAEAIGVLWQMGEEVEHICGLEVEAKNASIIKVIIRKPSNAVDSMTLPYYV